MMDVVDPIAFAVDPTTSLMKSLRENYEGKCYSRCLILSIGDILQHSEIFAGMESQPERGRVSVTFNASALVYPPGEVLLARIVNIDQHGQLMIAEVEHGSCTGVITREMAMLTDGMHAVVAVLRSEYIMGTSRITLMVKFHTPAEVDNRIFRFDASKLDMEIITPMLAEIDAVDWGHASFATYGRLLNNTAVRGDPIRRLLTGMVSVSRTCDKMKPEAIRAQETATSTVIAGDDTATATALLNDILSWARLVAKMNEVFNTDTEVKKHAKLFMAYRRMQQALSQ